MTKSQYSCRFCRVLVVPHNDHHGVQLMKRQAPCWVTGKCNKWSSTQTLWQQIPFGLSSSYNIFTFSFYFLLSKWFLQSWIIFNMFLTPVFFPCSVPCSVWDASGPVASRGWRSMVKHQPLQQVYEKQLCLSFLTGIYGCRWKRYQRSHDDSSKVRDKTSANVKMFCCGKIVGVFVHSLVIQISGMSES